MRLSLSDDQALLLETTRRLLDDHNPMTRVRELVDDPLGYDPAVWAKGADLGWFSMLIPEQFGGGSISGDGLIDLAIVAEALGAGLYGGPFLPTNVVAAAIAEMGTREQCDRYLPGIAAGERTATWAVAEVDRDWSAKPDTLRAVARGNDLVLNGSKTWVAHAASADVLLVVAAADDGPVYLLVEREAPGVTVEPLKALDLTNRFAEVRFEDVAVSSDAVLDPHKDNVNTDRILQVALCLVCADSNGVTDRGLDITVQYSKDRIAFGRPIGSYQALKHRMANYRVQL